MPDIIYKIATASQWEKARQSGIFEGAPIDIADGYIHFSTGDQVRETATKHFSGQADLILVSVDAARLGDKLKYETSRGGDLFPHLYDKLRLETVTDSTTLQLDESGHHVFPPHIK